MFNIQDTLKSSHDNTDEKSLKLINGFLKKRTNLYQDPSSAKLYWPAEFYGLDKSAFYQNANIDLKNNINHLCDQDILNESYFIEKIGIAYSAKLILMAPTTEIKQIFSFIAADEATHLQWLTPFIPQAIRTKPSGPLLSMINQIVQLETPNLLYYLVQIILEGWGIKHYKMLSQNCQEPQLKYILDSILQDEALHHHSGKSFFCVKQLNHHDFIIIKDILKAYCDLVRIGPQSVMLSLSKAMGGFDKAQFAQLYDELDGAKSSSDKLSTLFKLMNQPGLELIVQEIADEGYFNPYTAQDCAEVALQFSAK